MSEPSPASTHPQDERTEVLPETAVQLVEMERLKTELAAAEERAKNHWEQYLRALADVASLMEGQEATLRLLAKAFEKAQIDEINPEGQAFNPEMHEAMMTQPSEAAPGTVLAVVQKGYQLNGRLLRPARVVVSAASTG
jgi:molecular chaperone GrpE